LGAIKRQRAQVARPSASVSTTKKKKCPFRSYSLSLFIASQRNVKAKPGMHPQSNKKGTHHHLDNSEKGPKKKAAEPQLPPITGIHDPVFRCLKRYTSTTHQFRDETQIPIANNSKKTTIAIISAPFVFQGGGGMSEPTYILCQKSPFHQPSTPHPVGQTTVEGGTGYEVPDDGGAY
jgi:hypothetical protein